MHGSFPQFCSAHLVFIERRLTADCGETSSFNKSQQRLTLTGINNSIETDRQTIRIERITVSIDRDSFRVLIHAEYTVVMHIVAFNLYIVV